MTVQTTNNRVEATGNGATTAYPVSFVFLSSSDLKVYQNGTLKTITTHYTVSGGNGLTGTVTFVTAPAQDDEIVILRDPPVTQLSDLRNQGAFFAEVHEQNFDKLAMICQRLDERIDRSFVLPDTDTSGASTVIPTPEANAVVGWNSDATALQNISLSTLSTVVAFGTAKADIFDGDGASTAFTLSSNPGALNNLDVSIGGVTQTPGIDYTWSAGTTLTFTSAPAAGTNNVLVRYMQALANTNAQDAEFTPAGVGAQGTTIKLKLRERVSVFDFGAVGDGVADDTAAIQAAIDAARRIDFGDHTKTFKITSTLNLSAGNKWLSGNGATINMTAIPSGNYWGIKAVGSAGSGTAITSADVGDYTVSCANTTGFTAGDWVQISSGDNYPYGGGSYNVNYGEIKRIRSIVANTSITFTTPLLDTYTTTPLIRTLTLVDNVHIEGLTIQGSNTAARGERGIVLNYVNGFSVKNCKLDGQDIYQIEVASSINGVVQNNRLRSAYYDGVTGTIFYGIALLDSAQWVDVSGNMGERVRHLVVTSARTSGQGFYGQPYFINIRGNHCFDAMAGAGGRSYAYESHGFGRFVNFIGNTAHGCYAGIRLENGQDTTVIGNVFKDYGFAGIIVGGSGTAIKNLLIANNNVSGYTGEVTSGVPSGIRVEAASATVDNLKVIGNVLTGVRNGSNGTGISVGANTYTDTSIEGNAIDAGVTDANAYAVSTVSGANGIVFSGNRSYRFRSGFSLSSNNCVVKNNVVEHTAAQATGFGVYSNGDRNIVQGNVCRNINTAWRADTASTNNLFVNNQAVQCTSGLFSNAGTGNTGRDNDVI